MAELVLDVLLRIGENAVGVGIIRSPHHSLGPELLQQRHTGIVVLESRTALTVPIIAGFLLQRYAAFVAILIFLVHALENVRDPAYAALAEHDAQIRIALERP